MCDLTRLLSLQQANDGAPETGAIPEGREEGETEQGDDGGDQGHGQDVPPQDPHRTQQY